MRIFFTLCLFFILAACNQNSENDRISQLEEKLQELDALKNSIEQLKLEHISLLIDQANTTAKIERNINETVAFTPSDKGYASINSTVGTLLIAIDDIKKYANGYKIAILIGNPTLAALDNGSFQVWYGKAYMETENHTEWEKSLKTSTIAVNKDILSGFLNKVSIVLSPAKEEDLGYIRLAFSVQHVFLTNDHRVMAD